MSLIFGVRWLLCTFNPMVSENCVPSEGCLDGRVVSVEISIKEVGVDEGVYRWGWVSVAVCRDESVCVEVCIPSTPCPASVSELATAVLSNSHPSVSSCPNQIAAKVVRASGKISSCWGGGGAWHHKLPSWTYDGVLWCPGMSGQGDSYCPYPCRLPSTAIFHLVPNFPDCGY